MALYHKHRPQTFSSIWGQEHIIQTITNQIKNNKLAHAYLFSGPRGVGKTTTARLLAKAANCRNRKNGEFEPCDTCDSCQEITSSRSIDVMEMDAASHTGVDNVREQIIENAQTQPTKSKYKIFIIDEAHMLSTSAFNALLKTLEEPPDFVIFILATTELNKVPETIISRCQRFDFKRLPAETIKKQIKKIAKTEGVEIDPAVIDRIA
jgi:DNA polymerase-3 subunit gamma/tau